MGERVSGGREAEAGKNRLVDLGGAPSQDLGAGVQQHLHEAEHAGIVDFDTGDSARGGGDRQGEALEQAKIHVDVKRLSLKGREAVGNGGQSAADLVEIIEALLYPKSFRLLLSASRRRKVENFSYMRITAFLAYARST